MKTTMESRVRKLLWTVPMGLCLLALSAQAQTPAVPASATASQGTYANAIQVAWSSVPGATSFEIWRSVAPDWTTSQRVATVGGSTLVYVDAAVPANTSMYYWIRTVVGASISGFGYYHEGYWVPGPATPTNIQATDGTQTNAVRVTWNAVATATLYEIWRSLTDDNTTATLYATTTGLAYLDDRVDPQLTYYYWIKAVNADGASQFSWSNPGFAKPAAPTKASQLAASDGTSLDFVALTWAWTPGTARYEVWRSETTNLWQSFRIAETVTTTTYEDASAVASRIYTYWVRAVNSVGYGDFSNPDSGFRELQRPGKPLSLTASDGMYAGYVRVSWLPADRALTYDVLRNVVQDYASATVIAHVAAATGLLEYHDTSAAAGRVYFYWVRGVNNAGAGDPSWSSDGYWTPGPAAPTNVQATDGTQTNAVRVTWIASSTAVLYEVWRSDLSDSQSAAKIGTSISTSYLDTPVETNQLYYYWVRAANAAGTSGFSWSNSGYAAGPTPVPRAISLATQTATLGDTVVLPVTLTATGNENAMAFSVAFNPDHLQFVQMTLGGGAPGGALLIVNSTRAANGQIGAGIALPSGASIPTGSAEVVRVEFEVLAGSTNLFVPVTFADQPTRREVVNAAAQPLSFQWTDGGLTVVAPQFAGYEADVSPLPDGDGQVTLQDWVQIGRYVSGLDPAPAGALFDRADCAPRSTLGDGMLSLEDWVQSGRYAQGLDPLTASDGTTPLGTSLTLQGVKSLGALSETPAPEARVQLGTANLDADEPLPALIQSEGHVNALAFTVNFDASELTFVEAAPGPELQQESGSLLVNRARIEEGRLGLIAAVPTGRTLAGGLRKIATIRFTARHPGVSRTFPVTLTDDVTARSVVDAEANTVPAEFLAGTVTTGSAASETPPPLRLQTDPDSNWGELVISWPSTAGRTYRIERTFDLVQWQPIDRVTGQADQTTYRSWVEDAARTFLRVVEEP